YYVINRIAIQGNIKNKMWVTKYRLYNVDDYYYIKELIGLFDGNTDEKTIKYQNINPICTKSIIIRPDEYVGDSASMKIAIFGYKKDVNYNYINISSEEYEIEPDSISASSEYNSNYSAKNARIKYF